jgi:hypothetical protein
MKPRLGLYVLPPGIAAAWNLFLVIGALFGIVMVAVVLNNRQFTAGWQMGLAALQFFVLLPLPFIAGHNLHQSRRVLMSRAAPLSAWRLEVRAVCVTLFMAWLLTSACGVGLTLIALTSTAEVNSAIAYCGLSAVYMAFFTVTSSPQLWFKGVIWPLGCLPPLITWGLRDSGHGFADFQDAPWLSVALGVLVLLAVLCWLHSSTVRSLRVQPDRSQRSQGHWYEFLKSKFRRPFIDTDQQPFTVLPVLIASQLPMVLQDSISLLSAWGDDVTAWNLIRVLCLAGYAHMLLTSSDVHARNLLAPGGAFRRRLGQRVVASTLVSAALFAVVMWCTLLLIKAVLTSFFALSPSTPTFNSAIPLACELVLAVSLITFVRGWEEASGYPIALLFGLAVLLVLTLLLVTGLLTFQRSPPSFGIVGPTYVAALLALAALLTAASNRVWARADLARIYRRRQTPDALPDRGW